MAYLKDFQERINKNDYPGFLKLWEEYCYSDEPDGDEFIKILESVKNSPISGAFGQHIEKGLTLWKLIEDKEISRKALRLIFDIQKTNSSTLSEIAHQYLEQNYPNDPLFSEKLKLIGLRGSENFEGAISKFELLTHMAPGKYVFHTGGWGTCEIMDVSMVREEISLECDLVLGTKSLSFSNAFHTLYPLSDDHFLSRRFGNPDKLEKLAKEDPSEVIRILLRDLGPLTAAEMKEELFDLVIPAKDWNRWWQACRAKIKKDTKITTPSSTKDPFALREKAISHEEAFQKSLEKKPTIQETIVMVYSFLRDFPETLKNAEFKTSLEARVKDVLQNEDLTTAQKIQLYYFLIDLDHTKESKELTEIVDTTSKYKNLIDEIDVISFKKRLLTSIKEIKENWKEIFSDLLLHVEQNLLRDYLLNELAKIKEQEYLKSKIEELLNHPIAFPETFLWYFQKIFTKKGKAKLPLSDNDGKAKLFEHFLILLSFTNDRPNLRDLGKKIVNIITANRYEIVRDVMGISSIEQVKEYILLSTKCEFLTDHDKKIIQSLAEVVHPSLSSLRKSKDIDEEQEDIIWTTQEGLQKVQKRVSEIATVETLENAKEIEEAKSHGDLRENAEYKAALEKRDRLQSELKLLSSQLNKARVLAPSDVSTKEVNVGTIVKCSDSNSNVTSFTILGPWDANPEKHILSFQSKLAKEMIGKKVGESFSFQNENFSIQEIQNYFDRK
ncbi:MAG: GreA/GreB family elongation factor [Chlamydiota bacterium]|jgi:transcription elongation factor GreA-like protein/transcription elongation GreA/GreB family factor